MSKYTYELRCPRCKRDYLFETDDKNATPTIACGHCVWDGVHSVELEIVRLMIGVN